MEQTALNKLIETIQKRIDSINNSGIIDSANKNRLLSLTWVLKEVQSLLPVEQEQMRNIAEFAIRNGYEAFIYKDKVFYSLIDRNIAPLNTTDLLQLFNQQTDKK